MSMQAALPTFADAYGAYAIFTAQAVCTWPKILSKVGILITAVPAIFAVSTVHAAFLLYSNL